MPNVLLRACLVALALAALAYSGVRARAEESVFHCHPRASVEQAFGGVEFVLLTQEQFEFARGLYVSAPTTPMALPPGDAVEMGMSKGSALLLFLDGDRVCANVIAPKELADLLMSVGRGDVTHADGSAL